MRASPRESFCKHQFVVRSYYRRTRPGLLRRHVRWCYRCVSCHVYIGKGPIPSKPLSRRKQRRLDRISGSAREVNESLGMSCHLIYDDWKRSGREWPEYERDLQEMMRHARS